MILLTEKDISTIVEAMECLIKHRNDRRSHIIGLDTHQEELVELDSDIKYLKDYLNTVKVYLEQGKTASISWNAT